jgi:hypothetical protein
MKDKLKTGDVVRIQSGEGCFIDYETGFEVLGNAVVKIGAKIGTRTKAAFVSGGLVLVADKSKAKPADEKAEKPAKTAAKATTET